MKIVLAPDSFKGSLTADQACQALAEGLGSVLPDAEIVSIPLADGGEGTVDALVAATRGEIVETQVHGPLGEKQPAKFGLLGRSNAAGPDAQSRTAVIEMAAAAGLPLVPRESRNPLHTSTYGFGELILAALAQGCRRFIVGIGGSATNDCGGGMAQALGINFFDKHGQQIDRPLTGQLIGEVAALDCGTLAPGLEQSQFIVACDVENPLLGPTGATYIYGPQKGADENTLNILEANVTTLINLVEETIARPVRHTPGAGAAGGLGAALMAFLDAKLQRGVDIVLRESRFAERITGADLILTGEGRIDGSTAFGKTISGVARVAAEQGIPVIALAGSVGPDADKILALGVKSIIPVSPPLMPLEEALRNAAELLRRAGEQVAAGLVQIDDPN